MFIEIHFRCLFEWENQEMLLLCAGSVGSPPFAVYDKGTSANLAGLLLKLCRRRTEDSNFHIQHESRTADHTTRQQIHYFPSPGQEKTDKGSSDDDFSQHCNCQ